MAPEKISQTPENPTGGAPKTLREARREHIERVLRETDYDIPGAARFLGVSVEMLQCLMEELQIALPPGKEGQRGPTLDKQAP